MNPIILPKLGAHLLTERQRRNKPNEILSAPFPRAETTEDILAVAAEVERQGYKVVARQQRPVRLRAPKPGENAIVVGLTTDQPDGEPATVYLYKDDKIATGTVASLLWLASPGYEFRGSFAALKQYWREVREENQLNEQIRTDIMNQRKRQR